MAGPRLVTGREDEQAVACIVMVEDGHTWAGAAVAGDKTITDSTIGM
jgi:hypothetical protein